MFHLIGLGLNNEGISVKGLNACNKSSKIFIERYTSLLTNSDLKKLKGLIGKDIVELNREDLEKGFEKKVLKHAGQEDVSLLIIGDPLTATTHIEFLKACKEAGVDYNVVHSGSIFSSVCETGLHVYKFGKSCSIPFTEPGYEPTSFFKVIQDNVSINAHTLIFLDVKKEEGKYMSVNQGLKRLLKISEEENGFFNKDTEVIGIARLGMNGQVIKFGLVKELMNHDFGPPPHIIIIPCMTEIEREYVNALY